MNETRSRFAALSAPAKLAILALFAFADGVIRAAITSRIGMPSPLCAVLVSIGLRVLLSLAPFMLLDKLGTGRFGGCLSFGGFNIKRLPLYFAAMQLLCIFAGIIVRSVCISLLPNAGALLSSAANYDSFGTADLFVKAADLCVFTPLLEEYVFRGVVCGILKQHGSRFAILSSAFIFAVAHGSLDRMAYAFFAGLLMAALFIRTNDLRVTVVLHAVNNAIGLIGDALLPRLLQDRALVICDLAYLLFIVIFGAVSLVILFRSFRHTKDGGSHDAR